VDGEPDTDAELEVVEDDRHTHVADAPDWRPRSAAAMKRTRTINRRQTT
jgi:hypothetical protein